MISQHAVERLTIVQVEVVIARLVVDVRHEMTLGAVQTIDGACRLDQRRKGVRRLEAAVVRDIEGDPQPSRLPVPRGSTGSLGTGVGS